MVYMLVGALHAEPVDVFLEQKDLRHYDAILEQELGQHEAVRLWAQNDSGSWVEAHTLFPDVEIEEKYLLPAPTIGVDLPGSATGGLSGRAVYLSQCHGWIWFDSLGRFSTQRGNLHDTIEDFHNPEGMNQFLIQYLENAGASVFTAKERDHNTKMALSDNDGTGYSEIGSGFEDGPPGFQNNAPWYYGENPFDAGTTRRFPANSGSVATWIPQVPESGYYSVYISWDSDPSNSSSAHYRITHNGGVIDRYYDQRVHGSTWQYVEYLWLEQGVESLKVELIGDSSSSAYLSADAVRIGGGMGDVWRNGQGTGRPRWEEGAILYAQFNGAPTSVYDPYNYLDGSDPPTRSRWAAWEHPYGEEAVYLSWHSNAGGGTGTDTFYDESDPVDGSYELATMVHTQLIDSIRSLHDGQWRDRGVKTANFAEVNSSHNSEMPSALVELGFHDSEYDTQFLLDPIFRRDASRAMYRGIVDYFADQTGSPPIYLPEPPEQVKLVHTSGQIELSWVDGPVAGVYGDEPTAYKVFQSADGRSWDNGRVVEEARFVLNIEAGETQYVRVCSLNAGGISFPSEVLAVRKVSGDTQPPILIVTAFDRLQRSSLFWSDVGSVGSVRRMDMRRINAFDGVVNIAASVDRAMYPFDSISDEALRVGMSEDFELGNYDLVIWIAGEESTYDSTFTVEEQRELRDFVANGGKMIVSGSEIFWDLDSQGSAEDLSFALEVLGARLADDDANTELALGEGMLNGIELDFSFSAGAAYAVEYPDVLDSLHQTIAVYDVGGSAGIYTGQVASFGFPLETLTSPLASDQLFLTLLTEMLEYDPNVSEDTGEPVEDPTAPELPDEPAGDRRCGCNEKDGHAVIFGVLLMWVGQRRRKT